MLRTSCSLYQAGIFRVNNTFPHATYLWEADENSFTQSAALISVKGVKHINKSGKFLLNDQSFLPNARDYAHNTTKVEMTSMTSGICVLCKSVSSKCIHLLQLMSS